MNIRKYAPGSNITLNEVTGNDRDGWTQISIPGINHVPHTTIKIANTDRWIAVKDVASYNRNPTQGIYESVMGTKTPWIRWKNTTPTENPDEYVRRLGGHNHHSLLAEYEAAEARKEDEIAEMRVVKTPAYHQGLERPCINPSLDRYWTTFLRDTHLGGIRLHFVGDTNLTYIFDYPEELPPTLVAKAAVVMNQTKINGMLHTYNSHAFPYTRPTIDGFGDIGWPLDAQASVCVLVVTQQERMEWGADKHLLKSK